MVWITRALAPFDSGGDAAGGGAAGAAGAAFRSLMFCGGDLAFAGGGAKTIGGPANL